MRNLRIAFGLLTTLPFSLPDDWRAGESGRAAGWYPLVGLTVGALTWLAWAGAARFLPPLAAGVIALLAWVALTGGLHLDGLADCCDGLLLSAPRERRLEVMRDPHIGAFGVTGLVLVLLLKAAALSASGASMGLGLLLAATLARWCILPAALLPPARPDGLGADLAAGLRRSSIVIAALLPLALSCLLGAHGWLAALAGLGAAAVAAGFARARLGGVTGDVFGMLVEVVETTVLLACAAGVQ